MNDFILDFNMASEKIQSPVRYPSDLIDEEWEIIEPIVRWEKSMRCFVSIYAKNR
jgi:hypothetical protein